jgi:hypothetical protein
MQGPDWLARFIRWVMRDATFLGQYVCTVEGQDADGLLSLMPEDEKVRGNGINGVPIKVGLPGFKVKVPNGARVLLGWENGDPKKPYAALFDPNSVTEIQFADGSQAIARQGDLVTIPAVGMVVTLVPLPPAVPAPPNGALVAGVPLMISFSAIPPTPTKADPAYGSVSTGNPKHLS